jgi:murein DD-endopeptidase MepM/ murein hydrolase activator NlpD
MRRWILVPLILVCSFASALPARASGTWTWPVVGPVIRGFDPPDSPYTAGHRGIDIAAPLGTPVRAAAPGTVSFAGPVGGQLFVSVASGNGVVASYSFLSAIGVRKGDQIAPGAVVGASGAGHVGVIPSHLHFGVRVDGEYVDPMSFLAAPSVVGFVRLAPLAG